MKNLLVCLLGLVCLDVSFAQGVQKKPAAAPRAAERKAQLLAQAQDRIRQIDTVLRTVKWEAPRAPTSDLPEVARKAEIELNEWLKGVRGRLQGLKQDMQFGTTLKDDGDLVAKMAELNQQFLALQQAVQMESRKFKAMSSASKARHEAAMNAIRNMR